MVLFELYGWTAADVERLTFRQAELYARRGIERQNERRQTDIEAQANLTASKLAEIIGPALGLRVM